MGKVGTVKERVYVDEWQDQKKEQEKRILFLMCFVFATSKISRIEGLAFMAGEELKPISSNSWGQDTDT